eukprot:scaffold8972_cov118-Isochrysis_galbana.AAC.17
MPTTQTRWSSRERKNHSCSSSVNSGCSGSWKPSSALAGERVAVVSAAEPAAEEDAPREEGVHRRDVVEHIFVLHCDADEKDEKVEPPHHLREAGQREVGLDIVVREVAEAGHPHVGGDVDADRVVDLHLGKVVVEDKHELHPALPLLRLVALQRLGHSLAPGAGRPGGGDSHKQHGAVEAPEHGPGHRLGALGHQGGAVAQVDIPHNERKLGSRAECRQM